MKPSQGFLVAVLATVAGAENVVRDAAVLAFALLGFHLPMFAPWVGSYRP